MNVLVFQKSRHVLEGVVIGVQVMQLEGEKDIGEEGTHVEGYISLTIDRKSHVYTWITCGCDFVMVGSIL